MFRERIIPFTLIVLLIILLGLHFELKSYQPLPNISSKSYDRMKYEPQVDTTSFPDYVIKDGYFIIFNSETASTDSVTIIMQVKGRQ